MVGPLILTCGAFFSRKRAYATWAKVAYIIASIAGLVWGIVGFVVWPSVHVTRQTYSLLFALKNMCGGILIGFLLSVLIARPYQKRVPADFEEGRSTRV
jgi:hypothetical protein